MAPIYSSFSAYPSPAAFFEPSPTSISAVDPIFSVGTEIYAGAAHLYEADPSPVPSIVHHMPAPGPDTGLHQFLVWMAIIAAVVFLCGAYIVGRHYIGEWRAENVVDDEKSLSASAAFKPPTIALPPRSAPFGRSDHWHHQQRPFYISQADMLSSHGRGFFG